MIKKCFNLIKAGEGDKQILVKPTEQIYTYLHVYAYRGLEDWHSRQFLVVMSIKGAWCSSASSHAAEGSVSICPCSRKTPPSGSRRSTAWSVRPCPPPTCPRWRARSCWRSAERRQQTPHSCSTWDTQTQSLCQNQVILRRIYIYRGVMVRIFAIV